MCIAIPAEILEINGDTARVSVRGNILNADVRMVSAQVGDFVLVHAGCAVEVLRRDSAEEIYAMLEELEEYYNDA